jgi:hypothetical protein
MGVCAETAAWEPSNRPNRRTVVLVMGWVAEESVREGG